MNPGLGHPSLPDMTIPEGYDEARWQVCLGLARDLLLIDDDGADLTDRYRRVLIDEGLPRTTSPRRILIAGAGIAGLAAAHLLKQSGHEVRLIEANTRRIGGRIKTIRNDPGRGMTSPFLDPNQYAEAGAMRIPDSHPPDAGPGRLVRPAPPPVPQRRRRSGNRRARRAYLDRRQRHPDPPRRVRRRPRPGQQELRHRRAADRHRKRQLRRRTGTRARLLLPEHPGRPRGPAT